MKTQLFIKEISNNISNIKNANFANGIDDWNGGSGIQFFKENAYLDGSDPSNAITQDVGLVEGNYKVIINIAAPLNNYTIDGYLKIQLGDTIEYINSIGQHTLYFKVDSLTFDQLKLESVTDGVNPETFNGGIGFISAEGISGSFKEIELYDDTFIPITYNISDIKNFVNRQSTYSNTIKIPGTHKNNVLFRHIYNVNTDGSFVMNQSVKCYILYDGLNTFEGSFELLKVKDHNGIFYEGLVYSDFGLIFNKIANKTLRGNSDSVYDLDFSEYTQELNYDNIFNSWNTGTLGEDVIYAPIDKTAKWGNSFWDEKSFKISEISPSLYIKEIWDKIFEKAGFTYESDFIESETFKKLIYPHTDPILYDEDKYDFSGSQDDYGDDPAVGSTITSSIPESPHIERTIDVLDYIETSYDDDVTYSGGKYTAIDGGEYHIKINSDYKVFFYYPYAFSSGQNQLDVDDNVNFGAFIKLKIDRIGGGTDTIYTGGGVFPYPDEYVIINYPDSSDPLALFPFNFDEHIYMEAGDKIYIEKRIDFQHHWSSGGNILIKLHNGDPFDDDLSLQLQAVDTSIPSIEIKKTAAVLEGSYFNPTKILHKDFKQTDFVMSIIKMFNLYAEPISEKHFKIEPYSSFHSSEFLDWTNKVDLSQEISVERANNLIESILTFDYKEGKDDFNENYNENNTYLYGSFYFRMSQNNSDLAYKVETDFAPTAVGVFTRPDPTTYFSRLIIPKIYKVGSNGEVETGSEFKPRILFWNGFKSIDPYRVVGSTNYTEEFNLVSELGSHTYSLAQQPYFSNLDDIYGDATMDLNFGATAWNWEAITFPSGVWTPSGNLFNLYYKDMITDIASPRSKLVKMKILLNEKDINDISFQKLIFIKDTYYKLNKISNVIPNKFATVELINITNATIDLDVTVKPPNIWDIYDIHTGIITVQDLIKENTESGNGHINIIDGTDVIYSHSVVGIDKIDPGIINVNLKDLLGLPIRRLDINTEYKIGIITNSTELLNGAKNATYKNIINKE